MRLVCVLTFSKETCHECSACVVSFCFILVREREHFVEKAEMYAGVMNRKCYCVEGRGDKHD